MQNRRLSRSSSIPKDLLQVSWVQYNRVHVERQHLGNNRVGGIIGWRVDADGIEARSGEKDRETETARRRPGLASNYNISRVDRVRAERGGPEGRRSGKKGCPVKVGDEEKSADKWRHAETRWNAAGGCVIGGGYQESEARASRSAGIIETRFKETFPHEQRIGCLRRGSARVAATGHGCGTLYIGR